MIFARLLGRDGVAIQSRAPLAPFQPAKTEDEILITSDFVRAFGVFRAAARITAGTTTIVTPPASGSILLTDLMISGEKQAGSTTSVQFTDGTDTVTIFLASQVDAPPQIAIPFAGRFQGWKDAQIDMVTSGAGDATVTIGYVKVPNGLPFDEWDAYR